MEHNNYYEKAECMGIVKVEEVAGMKQEALGSKVVIWTRKKRFEQLVNDVSALEQELRTANTEESVNVALDKLEVLMNELFKNAQLEDIRGGLADISGTISGVKMHDITRTVLDEMLQKLIEKAKKIIAEETEMEKAEKLNALFMELAQHSDEISKLIDINKIFD